MKCSATVTKADHLILSIDGSRYVVVPVGGSRDQRDVSNLKMLCRLADEEMQRQAKQFGESSEPPGKV